MLSTDKNILEEKSPVHTRMKEYAAAFGVLYILLISKRETIHTSDIVREFGNLQIHTISFWKALFWQPSFEVDVVTAQDPFEIGLIGFRISRRLHIPLQLQIHTDLFSFYFTKESLLNKLRVMIARRLIPKARNIRVVSRRIKESLRSAFPRLAVPIFVLPVYIDAQQYTEHRTSAGLRAHYPQFEKILLMVSRMVREKNIGLAIEALPLVLEQFPKTALVIVGDGPERRMLEEKARQQKVGDHVIFEQWTAGVAGYYADADLFLHTSFYEGYGMVFIEAAMFGLPIVSTDVGIAKEVGAHIVGYTPREVAKGVTSLLQYPQKSHAPVLPSKKEYLDDYVRGLSE